MPTPDPYARTVRLLVSLQNANWCLANGGPLPPLRAGTTAELVLSPLDLANEDDRKRLTAERTVPLLPSGTTLWARVKRDTIGAALAKQRAELTLRLGQKALFVGFSLQEELGLLIRAGKDAMLRDCQCSIPALAVQPRSVNEAYTRISTAFEPSRRSHSGNVFRHVFFDRNEVLHPLDELRLARECELQTSQDLFA